jgi:hypothetical protein
MIFNRKFLAMASIQIDQQIRSMPQTFTSFDFYKAFEQNHSRQYEAFIRMYMPRHLRPYAVKIVHSQLMHTINNCFRHLVRKTHTIRNPKGGDMSEWQRV